MQQQPQANAQDKLTQRALATAPPNLLYGPEDVSTRRPRDAAEQRAAGLGWFSVGLGLAQLLAPRAVARLIGTSDSLVACATMRTLGAREIVAGVGILVQPRPNTFVWARVAGDIFDLALLTQQLAAGKTNRAKLGLAAAAVLGATALDTKTALDLTRARRGQDLEQAGVQVKHAITINAPIEQVYAFWRDLQNLPKFMAHLESVEVHDGVSKWRAKALAGAHVEWEAKITKDEPNAVIEWSSLPGSTISNRGAVRFTRAPGDRGTEVHVDLVYDPPGGALASVIAKLFGEEPKQQIKSDLRRLKQAIETGEVLHSDASIHAGRHPAQPAKVGNPPPKPTRQTRELRENKQDNDTSATSQTNQGFGTTKDDDAS